MLRNGNPFLWWITRNVHFKHVCPSHINRICAAFASSPFLMRFSERTILIFVLIPWGDSQRINWTNIAGMKAAQKSFSIPVAFSSIQKRFRQRKSLKTFLHKNPLFFLKLSTLFPAKVSSLFAFFLVPPEMPSSLAGPDRSTNKKKLCPAPTSGSGPLNVKHKHFPNLKKTLKEWSDLKKTVSLNKHTFNMVISW